MIWAPVILRLESAASPRSVCGNERTADVMQKQHVSSIFEAMWEFLQSRASNIILNYPAL